MIQWKKILVSKIFISLSTGQLSSGDKIFSLTHRLSFVVFSEGTLALDFGGKL